MQNLLVSIIIPVYKVEPYIVRCINSVLQQTYRNLEVILVDDCTPDHSMELAKECIAQSPLSQDLSFVYLKHDKNRGLSAARNTGIDAATGEYIYFLDSDDWIIPECIELMTHGVIQYTNVDMVYAGAKATTPEYNWMSIKNKEIVCYANNPEWVMIEFCSKDNIPCTAWNKFIRRQLILDNHVRFVESAIHEDEIWNMDLSFVVKSIYICHTDTYHYFIRKDGIMGTTMMDSQKRMENAIRMWKYEMNHLKNKKEMCYFRMIFSEIVSIFNPHCSRTQKWQIRILLWKLALKCKTNYKLLCSILMFSTLTKSRWDNYLYKRYIYGQAFPKKIFVEPILNNM